jgi:hypothetical protein
MRRRIVSLSAKWCFSAAATCSPIAAIRSLDTTLWMNFAPAVHSGRLDWARRSHQEGALEAVTATPRP